MKVFTERLIVEVFGSEDSDIKDFSDVMALYQNPDRELARKKLSQLATSLDIEVPEVPGFLEDYGDVYLSLAYYQEVLESISQATLEFMDSLHQLRRHPQLRQDHSLMGICDRLQKKVERLQGTAKKRFKIIESYTDKMWDEIDADKFRDFKKIVIDNHTALGAILCTLAVKMSAWERKSPTQSAGGIFNRAEFVRVGMQRGF
jgi:hypothetical protein